jgi:fatty-acyl-CoA synthase
MNLSWWLERACWEYPDKPAIIDGDGTQTEYASLRAMANRIGNVLREHAGVQEDEMVLTIMRDHHRHVATFWATVRIGAMFSGLNPKQVRAKYASDVERSGSRVLIVDPEFVEVADKLEHTTALERIYVSAGTHPRFASLAELCREASPELRIVPRSSSDAAAVNFTSGTSGVAKGVIFTHGTLTHSCWGSIFLAGVTSEARNLSLVGMFHSGGIHDTVRLAMAGGTLIWSDGWDVERVMRIFRELKPNWMYWIIPTMARDLMRHPEWPELDLQGLKAHIAGEPVPPDVEAALVAKGAQLGNMYGLTEAMPVCVLGPSLYYGDERVIPSGASGRPNKEFCEVKIADPITGEELRGGDVEGEVCIRGDVVTPGYFNDPERTAQTIDADGFLHTRDRAYRDEAGWCYVRGRIDDIINSGGEKLSLIEVDEALLGHANVVDAACIGVAHERFGEVPAAFVVLNREMSDEAARDMLDAHCLGELERWKRPRLYVFVDAVPRTAAKQSKWQGEMRRRLEGIQVRDADGVTTLAAVQTTADLGSATP